MRDDYWRMMTEWDAILVQPLSNAAKEQACLAVLRAWMARRAAVRFGQPNPPLRFYADMLVLQDGLASVEFGTLEVRRPALRPSIRLVRDWMRQNTETRVHA